MTTLHAFTAANRFGLGAGPKELEEIAKDPKGWALAQLDAKFAIDPKLSRLNKSVDTPGGLAEALGSIAKKEMDFNVDPKVMAVQKRELDSMLNHYVADIILRTRAAAESKAPFFERLVQFWSNHFTVSSVRWGTINVVAVFERDAIRPNIMGTFEELLVASTRHPAMLIYLDNVDSHGPNSELAREIKGGINENLAREIMELQTLGVNGGYTQEDVTEFARALTGWQVTGEMQQGRLGWAFSYEPRMHEPGDKKLLGKVYPGTGEQEARDILHDLAHYPSTAAFVATKLARHFVADQPPQKIVDRLAAVFTENKGQLLPVYREIVALDEIWEKPLAKLKTPNDFILSLIRAAGLQGEDGRLIVAARAFGQMPFSAPSPAGWGDEAKDWMNTESLLQRLGLSQMAARATGSQLDPLLLLEDTIGPVATQATRDAVAAAGSVTDAVMLLFSSPEFQRR